MGRLREEWNNLGEPAEFESEMEVRDRAQTYSHATVPTNYRDGNGGSQREVSKLPSNESRGTDDVQGGNTKESETRISSVSR